MSASDSSLQLSAAAQPGTGQGLVGPEQFHFLADLIPQLVWITDATGFHTYFNQRWIDFTGYTVADSVGPDMWNNLLHPADQARAREVWGHSLATGSDYEIEYRFMGRDGQYRWFLTRAEPIFDAEGQLLRWLGTNTDITDMRELQEQLKVAYSDLEAKVMFRTLDLEREVKELRQQVGK